MLPPRGSGDEASRIKVTVAAGVPRSLWLPIPQRDIGHYHTYERRYRGRSRRCFRLVYLASTRQCPRPARDVRFVATGWPSFLDITLPSPAAGERVVFLALGCGAQQ